MSSSNLQELQGWLSDRNCELSKVLEVADNPTIAKVEVVDHVMLVGLRERTRCHTSGEIPGTHRSCATRVNVCPFRSGASLKTVFSISSNF